MVARTIATVAGVESSFSKNIPAKVKDTQELRKELQNVKKLARERAKAITLRIPQLKDCKNHFDKKKEKGKGTMVFICEGQSAAGSITNCCDVNNQTGFVIKGKRSTSGTTLMGCVTRSSSECVTGANCRSEDMAQLCLSTMLRVGSNRDARRFRSSIDNARCAGR